ncbi:hypothetical protein J6590_071511 [Homalodisca vitripennis]|nr:hypothetical protein J6590_071511 [Homalodisca vitripennis]
MKNQVVYLYNTKLALGLTWKPSRSYDKWRHIRRTDHKSNHPVWVERTHQLQYIVLLRNHQQVQCCAAVGYPVYNRSVTQPADSLSVDTDHTVACAQSRSIRWRPSVDLFHKDGVHRLVECPCAQPQSSVPCQHLRTTT